MADRKPSTQRVTLHGLVVTSTVDAGRIEDIALPVLDSNFVLVSTRDIIGTNRVRTLDSATPLLTSSAVSFRGQPIVALFGYDSESVHIKAKEIKISYQLPSSEDGQQANVESTPYVYQIGSLASSVEDPELAVFERTYRFSGNGYKINTITRISVEQEGDTLHIYTPTQWPTHVRDTVSDITSVPKKRIVVHRLPFYAPHDEMLIAPSGLSAIAALACIKAGRPTEIMRKIESYRPELTIKRKSWYYNDGRIQAEQISVYVNQGCETMFSEEMANQLIAGLVPLYPLQALEISIVFATSNNAPAHFFGDLGYADALASTEAHYNALAKVAGYNPLSWRLKFASENPGHTQVIRTDKYTKLKELVTAVSTRSDYQRKNAAYEMQHNMRAKFSTFFNYSRGTALACGAGISGFSSEMHTVPQQAVQITLNANNKVEVNTSFYSIGSSADIWRQIICEELGVSKSDISFVEDPREMIDSGPSVLTANSGRMPFQIQKACAQIKEKRFVQPLPIVESVLSARQPSTKGSLFFSNSWVALVLELEIDAVLLQPVVRSVWASVSLARVFSEPVLKSKIRHTVVSTLLEAGALLSSRDDFAIDITISSEGDQISTSMTSALRGVVTAAYATALEQALGNPVAKVPVDGATLLAAMRGKA